MGTPRYACLKCDKVVPVGATVCPYCKAPVRFTIKANLRGAYLLAKEVSDELSQEQARARAERELHRELDKTPVSCVLISVQDKQGKSVMGAAGRALLGGALFGTAGAFLGAVTVGSTTKAQTAIFSVKYESGRKGTETVQVGSKRFEELAKLLVD